MDLDTYIATHRADWLRLAALTKGGRRRVRKMNDADLAQLVSLYQSASASLSYARSYYRDPGLVAYLTTLVAQAGAIIYATPRHTWRAVGDFFAITFPAAVFHIRRFIAIAAALVLVPAIVGGIWIGNSDDARNAAIAPSQQQSYVNDEFENYYDTDHAAQFASSVFTNNAEIAVTVFGSGLLFGIPAIVMLVVNGFNVGIAGGLFGHYDHLDKFFGLILPHGMLELTAITIAGAAGLYMGWALIAPGDRSRPNALREEGRRVITVTMGLVLTLFISGIIEGFVTGQPWPVWLRLGIGLIAEVGFITYVTVLGRRAARQGLTGQLGENDDRGWAKTPIAS